MLPPRKALVQRLSETLDALSHETYAYLSTAGRVTGEPHEIEIWWCHRDTSIFLLSGSGADADWVQNLQMNPRVSVRIGFLTVEGTARIVGDPEEEAFLRRTLLDRYERRSGEDLSDWSQASLPVAVDL